MLTKYIKNSPHRVILEEKINKIAKDVKGEVLDIGSKNRRYDHLFNAKVTAADLVENKEKNIIKADINKLPFPDGSFDAVLCFEVFEYLKTPEKAASEIYRVLKKGGKLYLSTPFMNKYHQDQTRYSKIYLEDIFRNFKEIKIEEIGNYYSIILDILRDKIMFINNKILRAVLYLPYLLLTLFLPMVKTKDKKHISGYFIEAKKC